MISLNDNDYIYSSSPFIQSHWHISMLTDCNVFCLQCNWLSWHYYACFA